MTLTRANERRTDAVVHHTPVVPSTATRFSARKAEASILPFTRSALDIAFQTRLDMAHRCSAAFGDLAVT
jgi:hypothetical protein